MKKRFVQKFITPDVPFAVLLSIGYIFIWILNYFFLPDFRTYEASAIRLVSPEKFWQISAVFLLTILNLVLIAQFNNKLNIIRTKTFLPLFIYALLIGSWKESQLLVTSHIGLTILIISLMLFLSMYRDNKAVEPAFLGSLLLSLSGFLNPAYLLLIILCWIGFFMINCASVRVFLASLMGTLVPWIFYFSYQLMTGNEIRIFEHFSIDFVQHSIFTGRQLYEQIYIGSILLLLLTGLGGMYSKMYNDSIQARRYLNFILVLLLFLILLVVVFSRNALSFLPMIAFGYAMLLSHPFSLNKSKFYEILFYIFTGINIAYLVFNIIFFNA